MTSKFLACEDAQLPLVGSDGDRGCPSCGICDPGNGEEATFVVDRRNRYWCFECAMDALANVRRRRDEREGADDKMLYPWAFGAES